jgi:hypothetical protein
MFTGRSLASIPGWFFAKANEQLAGRAVLRRGSAAEIALDDESTDVTVSGLALNFAPDGPAALHEMTRVTVAGGTIGAYVWDYADKMELMRYFWDAAVELDSDATKLDEGVRFPLCRPQALTDLFARAGLNAVEVTAIDITTPLRFRRLPAAFVGGQGPAPAYAMGLDQSARARLRERIRERIPLQADGSISLVARAWAVRGTVAAIR